MLSKCALGCLVLEGVAEEVPNISNSKLLLLFFLIQLTLHVLHVDVVDGLFHGGDQGQYAVKLRDLDQFLNALAADIGEYKRAIILP